jgi:hypothetical protein
LLVVASRAPHSEARAERPIGRSGRYGGLREPDRCPPFG